MMQEQLSALAGTHWQQFNQFSLDVDRFREEVVRFLIPKMESEQTYRSFTVRDAARIPQFRPGVYHHYGWMRVGTVFLTYLALVALLIGIGYRRMAFT